MDEMLEFDRKMSDAEGLMWRLEKDPFLSSTFATVMVLDRAPDFDRLRRRMERASTSFARLRQRVQAMPANVSAPTWVDDPHWDIDYHLRRVALPKPGSMRQLLDYVALVAADPFDRIRPLWQFIVVEGLRGGQAALVQKMHHTIIDGAAGVRLSLEYLDLERDAPEPPPLPAEDEPEETSAGSIGVEAVRSMVAGGLRLPLGVVRQVREMLADPRQLPGAGNAATGALRGVVSQLSETDRARSPLWVERSLRRRIEVLRAPYKATRDAFHRLGGSLNTAFITAAAHGAGAYHTAKGQPTDQLRASMIVSTRTEDSGSNAFTFARMLVPTGEMPIAERFAAIKEETSRAKEATRSGSLDTLASMTAALPTSVVTRMARQQSQTVDFATSNVRGGGAAAYIAGARMMDNFPVGPLGGVAFNLTLLSYAGHLDMGMHIDAAAVEDPTLLRECIERAFGELADA